MLTTVWAAKRQAALAADDAFRRGRREGERAADAEWVKRMTEVGADAVAQDVRVPHLTVALPGDIGGEHDETYPGCVATVTHDGVLLVERHDSGLLVCGYAPGRWLEFGVEWEEPEQEPAPAPVEDPALGLTRQGVLALLRRCSPHGMSMDNLAVRIPIATPLELLSAALTSMVDDGLVEERQSTVGAEPLFYATGQEAVGA